MIVDRRDPTELGERLIARRRKLAAVDPAVSSQVPLSELADAAPLVEPVIACSTIDESAGMRESHAGGTMQLGGGVGGRIRIVEPKTEPSS